MQIEQGAWGQQQARRRFVFMMSFMFVVVAMSIIPHPAYASTGAEFTGAVSTFQGWIQGNLGKLAALVALAVGSIVAAVKKDWSWFFGAIILSIGIGIIVTIINASFTATV